MKAFDPYYMMGVPAVLLLMMALTIGLSGLNVPLFLALQHLFSYLPDAFWANMTVLGDALVTLTLLSLLAWRYPNILVAGLSGGLLTTLVVRLFKPLIGAERPLAVLQDQVYVLGPDLHTSSFPSGHTTAIFLAMGIYTMTLKNPRLTVLLFLVAVVVGSSRIAVGAHWPVDVCAGAALGWSCAWAGYYLAPRWRWGHSAQGQRVLAGLFLLFALVLFVLNTGYPQAFGLQMTLATLATVAALFNVWKHWLNP